MRRKKANLHARVIGNLEVDYTSERLIPYGGLELMIRYMRKIEWTGMLRRLLGRWVSGGDYGAAAIWQAIPGLILVGGRRLRHLSYLRGDPLMQRFCALKDLPSVYSLSRFLKGFTASSLDTLKRLNADEAAGTYGFCQRAPRPSTWMARSCPPALWRAALSSGTTSIDVRSLATSPSPCIWRTVAISLDWTTGPATSMTAPRPTASSRPFRKNYQFNLFGPDDSTFEYTAVATNLSLGACALWRFMSGRGMHEKAMGELKINLAFDTIPTKDYLANSAWQQFVLLAHILLANFQIETGLRHRQRTLKCTGRRALHAARTLRFELFNRAGRLVRAGGKTTLRLERNEQVESRFCDIAVALGKAA